MTLLLVIYHPNEACDRVTSSLYPMLFILAVDVLTRSLHLLNELGLINGLFFKLSFCILHVDPFLAEERRSLFVVLNLQVFQLILTSTSNLNWLTT